MEVLARLDKTTGTRVLCGAIGDTCRGELATVRIWKGMRVLCMFSSWSQIGRGHFATNPHSAKRAAEATAAVRRGELPVDQLGARQRGRLRSRIPDDKDDFGMAYGFASDWRVIEPVPRVGILADCPIPSCGRTNLLLGSNLDVATE